MNSRWIKRIKPNKNTLQLFPSPLDHEHRERTFDNGPHMDLTVEKLLAPLLTKSRPTLIPSRSCNYCLLKLRIRANPFQWNITRNEMYVERCYNHLQCPILESFCRLYLGRAMRSRLWSQLRLHWHLVCSDLLVFHYEIQRQKCDSPNFDFDESLAIKVKDFKTETRRRNIQLNH